MHRSARAMVSALALLLVAAFAIVPGTARANMDRPTWAAGDFWVYAVGNASAQTTLSIHVTGTQSVLVNETSTANASYTLNYWSPQVGNWARIGTYDSSGRNQGNFNLTDYNYQGGSFFTSIVFGLPVWIWLILLVVILVAIIGLVAVRRRRPPTRAMPPSPPQMPPQPPMGREGPAPP